MANYTKMTKAELLREIDGLLEAGRRQADAPPTPQEGLREHSSQTEIYLERQNQLVLVSQEVLAETTLNDVLQKIAAAARELTGGRFAAACLCRRDSPSRMMAASHNGSTSPMPLKKGLCSEQGGFYLRLIENENSLRLTDLELKGHPDWSRLSDWRFTLRGLLGARLIGGDGKPLGFVMVTDKEDMGDFSQEDEAILLQLAALASLGIQHIEAREEAAHRAEALRTAQADLELRVAERTAKLAATVRVLQEEIAERKRIEEKLRKSAAETQDLYNNAPCGYHSLDKDGVIVRINATELKWLGYTQEEVVGRMRLPDLMTARGKLLFEETFPQFKLSGEVGDLEQEFVRKDGSVLPLSLSATALRDDKGDFVMSRSIAFDISERKEAEQRLRRETAERLRAMEELRQKDRIMMQQGRLAAMGEMIGNIAHQWRQPLNTLGLVIQRISFFYEAGGFSKEFLDSSTSEAMKIIQHMSRTIDDFRDFFRTDKEQVVFEVNQAIRQTVSLVEGSFRDESIVISINQDGDPRIKGYPNEYSQVILSILHNARDAFLERKPDKALVTISSFMEEGKTVVTIADNAGGIADDIMDKVFDPYFTTKAPDKGTGIGLFIAKNIIENSMRGRLTAHNTGNGAEFRIEV